MWWRVAITWEATDPLGYEEEGFEVCEVCEEQKGEEEGCKEGEERQVVNLKRIVAGVCTLTAARAIGGREAALARTSPTGQLGG